MAQYDNVLLGIVRRAMPNIIAQDILGVQPMTGPTGSIFSMRAKYGLQSKFPKEIKVNRNRYAYPMGIEYHKYFTRINNRRKTQTVDEMRKAGYVEVIVDVKISDVYEEWEKWMNDNLKYRFFYAGQLTCFFASESDRILYLLRWA